MSDTEVRTAWWGTCENEDCLCSMVIYPHSDATKDLPDEDDWEDPIGFISCPACGGYMFWGGTDNPKDIIKGY